MAEFSETRLGGTTALRGTFSGFQGREYGLSWWVDAA